MARSAAQKRWDDEHRQRLYNGARADNQRKKATKETVPSGIGASTLKTIIAATGGRATCGNCGSGDTDLLWSRRLELVVCGECRKKYLAALRTLPAACYIDRQLYLTNLTVPGTYWPDSYQGSHLGD